MIEDSQYFLVCANFIRLRITDVVVIKKKFALLQENTTLQPPNRRICCWSYIPKFLWRVNLNSSEFVSFSSNCTSLWGDTQTIKEINTQQQRLRNVRENVYDTSVLFCEAFSLCV
ncbi:CLUMA_CG008928, isoform A [Clunio marinus]|uniref:CLUMA_CG008928, isoform A n=1 Tax=Clunio marinus TaxID=568069 RepID=A0A1J1I5K1_9DIPT|nr:CLUMA_CG008928, isoform A [Clunio marinus]